MATGDWSVKTSAFIIHFKFWCIGIIILWYLKRIIKNLQGLIFFNLSYFNYDHVSLKEYCVCVIYCFTYFNCLSYLYYYCSEDMHQTCRQHAGLCKGGLHNVTQWLGVGQRPKIAFGRLTLLLNASLHFGRLTLLLNASLHFWRPASEG